MLPNFIIVGAPRCGTTFVARNLSEHPEIFVASGMEDPTAGDVHYFDVSNEIGARNHEKGRDWYEGLFSDAKGYNVIGEKTADYLVDEQAPSLIHEELGHVKIIVVLRDPVMRAWSHFCHSRHRIPWSTRFCDVVFSGQDPSGVPVLAAGQYYYWLGEYFNRFGSDNVHVVLQEDLDSSPVAVLKSICDFLGVKVSSKLLVHEGRVNQSSLDFFSVLLAKVGRFIRLRLPLLYRFLIQGFFSDVLNPLIYHIRGKSRKKTDGVNRNANEDSFPSECIEPLRNFYRADTERLSDCIGRDLSSLWWS